MPGIFGYFDPDKKTSDSVLNAMLHAIGVCNNCHSQMNKNSFSGVGIVNYKKSLLIDTSKQNQGQLQLFLGAMANKVSDKPSEYSDSYVYCKIDEKTKELVLITDKFASYPLYIYKYQNIYFFSTQIKAILAVLPESPELDSLSISCMLSIGEVVGNRTLINNLHTVPAATQVTLNQDGRTDKKYWEYQYEENLKWNWNDAVAETGKALTHSVAKSLQHGKNPAVPLSGGLDSRFLLDLACQTGSKPNTYTWGIEGCRDLKYAQEIADTLHCENNSYFFEPGYLEKFIEKGVWLTEGHTPATNFHVLPFLSKLLSRKHDLILDGFAGDGILGGNFINDDWLYSSDELSSAKSIWQWRRNGFDQQWNNELLNEYHELAGNIFQETYLNYSGHSPMDKAMGFLLDNRVRRITTCGTEIFRSEIQIAQPFMDTDFIEVTRTLPHKWRKRHRFYLAVLEKFSPVSAHARYQRTMLPADVPYIASWLSLAFQSIHKKAGGFIPMPEIFKKSSPSDFALWFQSDLKIFLQQILLSERTLERGVIPPELIKKTLDLHWNGQKDMSSLIGTMLSIEYFSRLFLDDISKSIKTFSA